MGKKDKTPSKTPAKENGAAADGEGEGGLPYAARVKFCSPIAKPLADEKLCKKVRQAAPLRCTSPAARTLARSPLHVPAAAARGSAWEAPPLNTAAPLVAGASHPCQVLKLAKKAAKRKQLKRGVKEVVKAIRKNVKG